MVTQRIRWFPVTTPNVIAYEIIKSDTGISGEYTTLTQVLHQIPGSNWDSNLGCFFYDDIEIPYRYYRLRTLDQYGNTAEDSAPTPFQANNDPVKAPALHFIALTENTGGQNNYKYVTSGGTPVEGATIRVYKKIDWDTRRTSKVVGSSLTNATGGWAHPVFVEPGETYTIVWSKLNEYGPDTAEVTV